MPARAHSSLSQVLSIPSEIAIHDNCTVHVILNPVCERGSNPATITRPG